MASTPARRGRPQATTADTLCEAAFELFQLNGYEETSVSDIARTAGVSRATFFNYFNAKSDVFWRETDQVLEDLPEHLYAGEHHHGSTLESIQRALLAAFSPWEAHRVPWIFTQYELIGGPESVRESATIRVVRAQVILAEYVRTRLADPHDTLTSHTAANAIIGAVIAAALTWAADGPGRSSLGEYLDTSLSQLSAGLATALERSANS
jgi:AcrR family transcriptional regulator